MWNVLFLLHSYWVLHVCRWYFASFEHVVAFSDSKQFVDLTCCVQMGSPTSVMSMASVLWRILWSIMMIALKSLGKSLKNLRGFGTLLLTHKDPWFDLSSRFLHFPCLSFLCYKILIKKNNFLVMLWGNNIG